MSRDDPARTSGIKVTLVRSQIGIKPKQRGTLRALGLDRIGSTNTLPDRPEVPRDDRRGCRISSRWRSFREDPRLETGARFASARSDASRRGIGGKGGKTAGRGSKGQGARSKVPARFEGGQTPLHRRTPKAKGFNNPFRIEYHVVNLSTLDGFDAGSEVTPDTLRARGLVAKRGLVKILARGEITKPLTVRAHGFSAAAVRAIEARGRIRRGSGAPVADRASPGTRERAHEPLATLPRPVVRRSSTR